MVTLEKITAELSDYTRAHDMDDYDMLLAARVLTEYCEDRALSGLAAIGDDRTVWLILNNCTDCDTYAQWEEYYGAMGEEFASAYGDAEHCHGSDAGPCYRCAADAVVSTRGDDVAYARACRAANALDEEE